MTQFLYKLYIWFYALPIWRVMLFFAGLVLFWAFLRSVFSEMFPRIWRCLNVALAVLAFAGICASVLFRTGHVRELALRPFITIERAKRNIEAYRSALMNVVLFIPLGLTLPNVLSKNRVVCRQYLMTAIAGILLSIVLETMQYVFWLGTSETDDVITNTVGMCFGAAHIFLSEFFLRIKERKTRIH